MMKDRIQKILIDINLKKGVFAEKIGVSAGSISQWLSGRQSPNKENIEKILQEFPRYSRNWLLNGIEPMLVDFKVNSNHSNATLFDNVIPNNNAKEIIEEDTINYSISNNNIPKVVAEDSFKKTISEKIKIKKNIEKIVFFYSDKSFEIFENND